MAKRTCSIDGCDSDHYGRGWCHKHYQRWWKYGDPAVTKMTPVGDLRRWLDEHLDSESTDACVEWPYGTTDGYGVMRDNGVYRRVTHLVLERTGRPRPDPPNHHALHSCDNPPCVNDRHLRWGSNEDNIDDRERSGRTARGEDSGHTLTEDDVREIRRRYETGGITQLELAEMYGVTDPTICMVINRKTWTHI